jgi:hypothetical protein
MEYIDAEVKALQTNYTVGPDVDVRQLRWSAGLGT